MDAAVRELREESGLVLPRPPRPLGCTVIGEPPAPWHFFALQFASSPDGWTFAAADDGGHVFSFVWHPLNAELDGTWHPMFHKAFHFVRQSDLGRSV